MHTSQENETIVDAWLFVIVSGVQVLQRQWRRCGEVQQKDGCPVYTAYRLPRGGAEFWWVVVFDEQFHTGPQSILQDKPQQPPLTGNARLNARSRPRAGVINSHANLQAHPRKKRVFNPGCPGLSWSNRHSEEYKDTETQSLLLLLLLLLPMPFEDQCMFVRCP